jgi:hypothetical protein
MGVAVSVHPGTESGIVLFSQPLINTGSISHDKVVQLSQPLVNTGSIYHVMVSYLGCQEPQAILHNIRSTLLRFAHSGFFTKCNSTQPRWQESIASVSST